MSDTQTFVAACLTGDAMLSDIDDYVSRWHDSDDPAIGDLPAYLGMSRDEYRLWVERPESLRFILAAHKNRRNVTDFVLKEAGLTAAARAEEKGEAVQVLRWLMKTGRVDEQFA